MRAITLSMLVLLLSFPVSAGSRRQPAPAVLMITPAVASSPQSGVIVEASTRLVSSIFTIDSGSAGTTRWPVFAEDASCLDGAVRNLEVLISAGRRQFFEEMDTGAAVMTLTRFADSFVASPCLRGPASAVAAEGCSALLLLVRLLLLEGVPESAAARSGQLAAICGPDIVDLSEAPPEVVEFVRRAFDERAAAVKVASPNVRFICPAGCGGVLFDGIGISQGSGSGEAWAAPGKHRIDVLPAPDGSTPAFFATVETDGSPVRIVVAPGSGVTSHSSGAFLADRDPFPAAAMLGAVMNVSVVGVVDSKDGYSMVILHDRLGVPPGRLLAVLSGEDEGFRFTAQRGSELEFGQRKGWPWPWVAGGLSAGFLTAGIALNVMQQKTVNRNVTLSEKYRDAAIAGYATAGAGLLSAILLAVLRPDPEREVFVAPSSSGLSVVFKPRGN